MRMRTRNLILFCLSIIVLLYLSKYLDKNAGKGRNDEKERLDEENDPCSDYEPRHPIPKKPSDPIPKTIVIPLVGIGVAAASIFGAPLILGALGFQSAGIAPGSFAAWLQSMLYAGAIPAGSLFASFQGAGMTGVAITKGTAITLGTISSGTAYYWYGSDKVPGEEEESSEMNKEWSEMNEKCNDCVINRLDCRLAKIRLFEHLEREKSQIGWFSSIQTEKLTADENWESFVRLSCGCFPVFRNKQKEGEGLHEKELVSLFDHYVPYFYTSNA